MCFVFLSLGSISQKSFGSFPSVTSASSLFSSLSSLFVTLSLTSGRCSVPSHVPQTPSVHATAARVPSPTLVCSTVPPYRYTARIQTLTETHGVSLTSLILAKRFPFTTAKHSFQSACSLKSLTLQDVKAQKFLVMFI